jgi:deoxyribodipyrimidine photo-lyase
MRELATSHIMHNRARLITANFLNRILGMDWRRGEQYYRSQLVDYDPAVNNGNWQWVASTGVDPKPYFQRLFNPWLQSAKFDPDATYIKKWLPNLAKIPAQHLHEWDKYYSEYDLEKIKYVKPMVDYDSARKLSIAQYQAVL